MPYKDPEKQKAALRKAQAKFREKHPDKATHVLYEGHQKKRAERLERMLKRSREAGHKERVKGGPRAKPKIKVPASRRYRFFKGPDDTTRVYFATLTGFTLEDMKTILAEFKTVLLPSDSRK